MLATNVAPCAAAAVQVVGTVRTVTPGWVVVTLRPGARVDVGDTLSITQYGEEIARAKVESASSTDAVARVTERLQGTIVRVLDTVAIASGAPGPSLSPVPPASEKRPPSAAEERQQRAVSAVHYGGDIVPWPHWTYAVLSELAARGLLPGIPAWWFHGGQLLTTDDVQKLLAIALPPQDGTDAAAAYAMLVKEYGAPGTPVPQVIPRVAKTGYTRGLLADTLGQTSFLGLYRSDLWFRPTPGTTAILTLTNEHKEWQGTGTGFSPVDTLEVRGRRFGIDWDVGKTYLRWGPGYTGSLILSDNAQAIPMVRGRGEIDFGRLLGRWRADQFVGGFDEGGAHRYIVGRRLERSLGSGFSLGLSETMKLSHAPNPLALVLPVLLYQRLFDKDTNKLNALFGADVRYRDRGYEGYAELLIDDITAPKGFRSQGRVRRKLGYLVGMRREGLLGDRRTDVRFEYVRIDRETYLHRNPAVSYYERGRVIGHPIGPNGSQILLRADRRLSPRLEVTADIVRQWSTISFLPPIAERRDSATIRAMYDLSRGRSVGISVGPARVRLPGGHSSTGIDLQVVADLMW